LPSPVDADKVDVATKDEELVITLPKSSGATHGSHSGGVQYNRQRTTHIGGKVI